MNNNFGLGALGLDTIEYPDPEKSQLIFQKESSQQNEQRRIQRHQLEYIKRYYEKHPDALLPSGEYGSKLHIDENSSVIMERTVRRR